MRFIETSKLEPGMVVGKTVISTVKSAILQRGIPLTQKYIDYLIKKGYVGVYVEDNLSEDIVIEETIDPALFLEGMLAVQNTDIGAMGAIATEIVSSITTRDEISMDLIDLRSYDDYTYHHSVNVAVYCAVVGRKLGLSEKDLDVLCMAGIAHDLGKMKIPQEILNKEGKLTDDEYNCIKQHPRGSFDILSKSYGVSALVKQAVLCHHENENGTGYPLGKEGDEIPYLAKIIHVVDVYDALTSKRPYKNPYSREATLDYLICGKGILFDEKVVDALIAVISVYPAGTEVVLSNGEEAIVIEQSEEPHRPIIRMKSDGREVNLYSDMDYENVHIAESSILEQNSVEKIEHLNESRQAVKPKKKKVMIVSDAKMVLMPAKEVLQQNYDVIAIENGMAAINHIKEKGTPDLLIIDIEMSIMSGLTAAKTLRDDGYTQMPIIFISASKERETILKCKELGAVDYILKPVKPVYLYERVRESLHMNV